MKVERIVDTVRVEMDINAAEQLLEILSLVEPTGNREVDDIVNLRAKLNSDAEVRFPSPLYKAQVWGEGVSVSYRTPGEYEAAYEDWHGTLDVCDECAGTTGRHFLSCSVWKK